MLSDVISTVETAVIQLKTQSTESIVCAIATQSVPITREEALVYFHIIHVFAKVTLLTKVLFFA
jgi:hypothetical protein